MRARPWWWLGGLAVLAGGALMAVSGAAPAVLGWAVGAAGLAVTLVAAEASNLVRLEVRQWLGRGPAARKVLRDQFLSDLRGRVPRVHDVGPLRLGVHAAARVDEPASDAEPLGELPVYVPRDCDHELATAVAVGGLVVVEGRSAAGKSRTAAEVIRQTVGRRWLLVPRDGAALAALVETGLRLRQTVVWLDDLERFVGDRGLDPHLLERLSAGGRRDVVVLATLREEARRQLEQNSGLGLGSGRIIGRLLQSATTIRPGFKLSEAERERAMHRRSDPWIADWLDRGGEAGLAEYIAAGPAAVDRWLAGRDGSHVVGAALVSAAIDCRRAGFEAPVTRALLAELYPHYLDRRDENRPGQAGIDDGLAWATEPVRGASSCLVPRAPDAYSAFDYLVDHVERDADAAPVPRGVWPLVLANASRDDLRAVVPGAQRSANATHDDDLTTLALETFAEREAIPEVWALVGQEYQMAYGRPADAKRWLARAAEAGHELAEVHLRWVLVELGDVAGARTWLQPAAANGDVGAAAQLGEVLFKAEVYNEAEPWLRVGAEAGEITSMRLLGELLVVEGQVDEGVSWLRRVVDDERPDREGPGWAFPPPGLLFARGQDREFAMVILAAALRERDEGDPEAERLLRRAAAAGHPTAIVELAHLLRQRGEHDEVEALLAEASDIDIAVSGLVLLEAGEITEAEWWLRRAAEAGVPLAMRALGDVLRQRGHHDDARAWYERAAEQGDADVMVRLGLLHEDGDDMRAAKRWYREAADADHPQAPTALARLQDVESWLRGANAGNTIAMAKLAYHFEVHGDALEAERWARRLRSSGDTKGMLILADLLDAAGQTARAALWRSQATRRPPP